jgi:hypothetical protein
VGHPVVSVMFRFFKQLLYKKFYLNKLLIPSPITNEGEEHVEKKAPKINFSRGHPVVFKYNIKMK